MRALAARTGAVRVANARHDSAAEVTTSLTGQEIQTWMLPFTQLTHSLPTQPSGKTVCARFGQQFGLPAPRLPQPPTPLVLPTAPPSAPSQGARSSDD